MLKHLDIFVYGKVQGVSFRAETKKVADNLEIKGYAKNEGRFVYIEAEGEETDLENFLEWCHSGPESAKVEKIDFKESRLKAFRSFSVL
jgi:acylphosphatase